MAETACVESALISSIIKDANAKKYVGDQWHCSTNVLNKLGLGKFSRVTRTTSSSYTRYRFEQREIGITWSSNTVIIILKAP
jgi:hypothetical protein